MKYINAEKLKETINKQLQENADKACLFGAAFAGRAAEDNDIINLIDSLQEEQPKVDLVAELKHHLATTPKEQLEKEWKELEPWGNIGPTVQEFLYGKQPAMDLEKEIDSIYDKCANQYSFDWNKFARHFYNLGLNARKV